MEIGPFVLRLIPVLSAMALATVVEAIVPLLDRALVYVWVTPDMHKVHHSTRPNTS